MCNKSINIRLDASHKKGMGHLFRMLTLGKMLAEAGYICTYIIRKDEISEKILSKNNRKFISMPTDLPEYQIIDHCLSEIIPLPQLWILDILDTQEEYITLLKNKGIKIVCFDDTKAGLKYADLVVNTIVHCWNTYNSKNVKVQLLEGIEYAILPPEIKMLRKKRTARSPIKIAISMGGSDTYGITVKISECLTLLNRNDFQYTIITGPQFQHKGELYRTTNKHSEQFTIKHFVQNLYLELNKHDLIICGGGSTLYEVCSMGLPALAFANELHEERTIKHFVSHGICKSIGSIRKPSTQNISTRLDSVLNDLDEINSLAKKAYEQFKDNNKCLEPILKLLTLNVSLGACI